MRKILLTCAFVLLSLLVFAASTGATSTNPVSETQTAQSIEKETERILIGFKEKINLDVIANLKAELHHELESIQAIAVTVPKASINSIRQDERVQWVEKDQEVSINAQVVDWGYEKTVDINTKKLNITGNGVKIGIIDTGVSTTHPDLKVAGGATFVEGTTTYADDNGHGTHVAGIIAAKDNDIGILGVAPNAEIYAIKALDQDGEGSQFDVIAAIEWAIDKKLDIINLSLTNPAPSEALRKITQKAYDQGIILVAASGNIDEGKTQGREDILYPAKYKTVIGVGSINENLIWSAFSYIGPSLEYVAPGENIYSTYVEPITLKNSYAKMNGTSMAAPFVTGIIALYKEVYPELSTKEIKNILNKSALDLCKCGRNNVYGYGLIQSPETYFWDLSKDKWYSNAVTYLKQENHINGYPDGSFQPGGSITRGEVVNMVGKALKLNGAQRDTIYPDVKKGYFASGYIDSATADGWITGYPTKDFKPNAKIKRADVALIIQRAFEIPLSETHAFMDVRNDMYYYQAVNALYTKKVITGYEDGRFLPDRNISRAEFSLILSKVLDERFR